MGRARVSIRLDSRLEWNGLPESGQAGANVTHNLVFLSTSFDKDGPLLFTEKRYVVERENEVFNLWKRTSTIYNNELKDLTDFHVLVAKKKRHHIMYVGYAKRHTQTFAQSGGQPKSSARIIDSTEISNFDGVFPLLKWQWWISRWRNVEMCRCNLEPWFVTRWQWWTICDKVRYGFSLSNRWVFWICKSSSYEEESGRCRTARAQRSIGWPADEMHKRKSVVDRGNCPQKKQRTWKKCHWNY